MAYPHAMKTGNDVIAAALAWDHAVEEGWYLKPANDLLREKVAAHRAATATEHVQGPDLDADRHGGTP